MDAAYLASHQKTSDRLKKVAQREQDHAEAILPTTYQGFDAARGLAKRQVLGGEILTDSVLVSNTTPAIGQATMPVPSGGLGRQIWKPRRGGGKATPTPTPTPTPTRLLTFGPNTLCIYTENTQLCGNIVDESWLATEFNSIGQILGINYKSVEGIYPADSGENRIIQGIDVDLQIIEFSYLFSCLDDFDAGFLGVEFQRHDFSYVDNINYEIRLWRSDDLSPPDPVSSNEFPLSGTGTPFVVVATQIGIENFANDLVQFEYLYNPSRITNSSCSTPGRLYVRFRPQFRKVGDTEWLPTQGGIANGQPYP